MSPTTLLFPVSPESRIIRPASAHHTMIYSADQTLFAVRREQSLPYPRTRGMLEFSGEFRHEDRMQKVFIAMMEPKHLSVRSRSPGVGVAIDLQTGLVTDLVNDQGVLGYLERATLAPHTNIRFTLELDVMGRVCVPRLIVEDDEILHPALYLESLTEMSGLTGTSIHPAGDAKFNNCRVNTSFPRALSANAM